MISAITLPRSGPHMSARLPLPVMNWPVTLYDSFTNRQLPILDERITAENPWVPLGQGSIVGSN